MADTLEEKQTKTLIKRVFNVKSEVLVDAFNDTLNDENTKNLGNTLAHMKAEVLVHSLGDTVEEQKPERQS